MNLVIDGFVLRYPRTGIVNYVYNVIEEVLKRSGVDLFVLLEDKNFYDDSVRDYVLNELNIRTVEVLNGNDFLSVMRNFICPNRLAVRLPTPKEVSRSISPGEIYHATDWYHYPGSFAKANIITYFDMTAIKQPEFHEKENIEKEKRKIKNLKFFDKIIAISESTRSDLLNHTNIDPGKVIRSYLGTDRIYDAQKFMSRDETLKKLSLDSSSRYILSLSTIEPRKNIIGILKSYERFRLSDANNSDVKLVLSGGGGWKNSSLQESVLKNKFKDDIIFTGYVSLDDMPSIYHHASCFIYLSFYEGFGLPILEAMKSYCPVVCSNTSSMPEVIGSCGELVSPTSVEETSEALSRVLDDERHANALRIAAFNRSKEFTWSRHVDDLMNVYSEL